MNESFEAPFSLRTKLVTGLVVGALIVGSVAAVLADKLSVLVLLLFTIFLLGAFSIRGYALENGTLVVERLGWKSRIKLGGLKTVEVEPEALKGCVRLWGIGGVFGTIGILRSKRLGTFRAYVTDESNTVLLEVGRKKVVVSPSPPEEFVAKVKQASLAGSAS
jgi:Bacterial PH domain